MLKSDYNQNECDYHVIVNGLDITSTVNARLESLSIIDNAGHKADTLSLSLIDFDGKLEIPPTGAAVEIKIGFKKSGLISKGIYTIDDIEHSGPPDIVTISGASANMGGTLPGQKSRSFSKTTLGEIVTTIAAEHKLTPRISPALAGIRINHIDQTAESDLNLLSRLANRYGGIATVKEDRLLFIPEGAATTVSGIPLDTLTLARIDIANHRWQSIDRDSYSGVKAAWNDKSGGKRKWLHVGESTKLKELRESYEGEEEARTAATAELARIKRGQAELSISLSKPNPSLIAETPVKTTGLKQKIDEQNWVADTVTHSISPSSGLTTSFTAKLKG